MILKLPFVKGGECYTAESFNGKFVCYECGSELSVTHMERECIATCSTDKSHSGIKLKEIDMASIEKMPVELGEITTLTGLKYTEAIVKLNERLEDKAYKEIPKGAFTLTDIGPAYLLEKLTEIFGPNPVGWSYDFDVSAVECVPVGSSFLVTIIGFELYYTLVWGGESHIVGPIKATGGSKNSTKEYALKGAVTNALGTAAHRLGWQLDVYKGIRTHLGDVETETKASEPSISFLDLMSFHIKARQVAISGSSLSPIAQYILLKSLDSDSPVVKIGELVTEPVWKAMWENFSKLLKLAKCKLEVSKELFDKEFKELTIGEFRIFWTSMAMIAGGEKKADVVKRMKELSSG